MVLSKTSASSATGGTPGD